MQDLKDVTNDVLYENYRSGYLSKINRSTEYVLYSIYAYCCLHKYFLPTDSMAL